MALAKVLRFSGISRADRVAVWQEYFRVHSDLKRNKPQQRKKVVAA